LAVAFAAVLEATTGFVFAGRGWIATTAGLLTAVAGFCAAIAGTTLTLAFAVAGEGLAAALFCADALATETVVFAAGFSTTVGVCALAADAKASNKKNVSVRFIKSCLLPLPGLQPA
jgi:hypothetical protein